MKPVSIEDFSSFKYLSNVTYSPAGNSACFVVTESDLKKNEYSGIFTNIITLKDLFL